MREVSIEFTRPSSWFKPLSWAIRLIEGTPYSHVRLRFKKQNGIEMVYEASGTSVKFIGELSLQELKIDILHSYSIGLTNEQFSKMIDICVIHANLDYGKLQLLGILLVRIFGLKKNPLSRGRKSQVCSEIVGKFLQEILDIGHDLNLDIAGPKAIQDVLERHPSIWRK